MKSISTHLLALGLGMAVVLLWPCSDREATTGELHTRSDLGPRKSTQGGATARRSSSGTFARMMLAQQLDRKVTQSDLKDWIASMGDDPALKGQALAIAGLMLNDPDLIRQGIAVDPRNPHILFIGANFTTFEPEERFELRKRLMEADPDNALAAYMTASHLMAAGKQQEAMDLLISSEQRSQMNDFGTQTQLLTEEAYIAAGLSPGAASIRSTFDFALPHLIEMRSLTDGMKSMHVSMSPEDATESRRMAATMGYRLSNQASPNTMVNQLAGMALELSTLEGLPDDAPSSYQGLTVSQARQNILAERERLRQTIEVFSNHHGHLMSDPDLMQRYVHRFRLSGEAEAVQWLQRTLQTEGQ